MIDVRRLYYLRWITAAIGVVAVLVLAMCLAHPNDTGTVTGFVYERSGLNPDPRPVGGTTVTATPIDNTREMESAMTASNGSYFFRLLPGTYELAAKADWYGLEGTPVPVVVTPGESATLDFTFTAP
jgi:hypothetical protein